jgi:hypothetical protein
MNHDCSAFSAQLSAATCKEQRLTGLTGKLASPPSALVQMFEHWELRNEE